MTTQKTIDEIAGLIMYMDDLICLDPDNNPFFFVDGVRMDYNRDYTSAQNAIDKFKLFTENIETEECWKDGKHCGDCTHVPATCMRCLVEDYRERAAKLVQYLDHN